MKIFSPDTSIRLSVQFLILYSALTAGVLVAAYFLARFELDEWTTDQLQAEAYRLVQTHEQEGLDALVAKIDTLGQISAENYEIYLLEGPDGTRLAGNIEQIKASAGENHVAFEDIVFLNPIKGDDENSAYAVWVTRLGDYRLTVGMNLNGNNEVVEALAGAMGAGFVVVVLVGLIAGAIVGRKTEVRIDAISRSLDAVSEGDFKQLIRVRQGKTDDLTRVSAAVNRAIGRLEQLVESQRQISADIAHDLRTPLQRLRQRLEAMQSAFGGDEAAAKAVEETIAHVDEIIGTFHALLRIAQIESGDRKERFRSIDITQIFASVADAYEAVAEEAGHCFASQAPDEPVTLLGDAELIAQMLSNLVENAIRHCHRGAKILVALEESEEEVRLCVSDDGKGISPQEHEKVFRRFYRLEKSRTSAGNGLGLALVKAVADLHGATIALDNNEPGLRVTVAFPKSEPKSSS